jgi:hypothetical protein
MPFCGDPVPPIVERPHTTWYHGSPFRLETLVAGSTVTPVIELAKVFSHKPAQVDLNVTGSGADRRVVIDHNGREFGYLYRVVVDDPKQDLEQHPGSGLAPGEEVLTTRELALEFIGEVGFPE